MLQNVPVTQMPGQTLFLQDDAPAHFTHHKDVRDFLNEKFSGRQIGTIGPIAWPARSPLTPGFLIVYQVRVHSLRELMLSTVTAVENIPPEMVTNTWQKIES